MKRVLKIIAFIAAVLVSIIILFLGVMATYHHIMLSKEKSHIKTVGTLVEVDGFNMNVYIEGVEQKKENPTIVLLSGSGVSAPLYDYKELYSKLTDKYRIAVVEKFGYGYSDVSRTKRNVATMVEEDRKALQKAGENGPYVLMPHSMSALEAIYWAETYPDEVKAIIGLDMAVPDSYNRNKSNQSQITFMKVMTFFGMHRIPAFNYVNEDGLTKEEIQQHKYLVYRNSLNADVYEECKTVYDNAEAVKKFGTPNIPILMFTTNLGGSEGSKTWEEAQDNFAGQSDKCIQIKLETGHNLHYYKSDDISKRIKEFMENEIGK
jgi:pimeloyl-ACP methyl ester carboxylesterase